MKKAVLLVNLGSPASPSVADVRRYLRDFLMDGRVLDMPWLARFGIVHGVILPFRPRQSAAAYRRIWTPAGAPLMVTSRNLQAKLQSRVSVPVELAMRYPNPSIPEALRRLVRLGVEAVLVIPLFPHYARSSFETAVARVEEAAAAFTPPLRVQVQPPYFEAPEYIAALAGSAREYLQRGYDHLLFSFHGLPERHLRKADPTGRHCLVAANCCTTASPAQATCYRAQCFKTVAAFVRQAGVPEGKYSIAFQSRMGRAPWLKPYTDHELSRLARSGIKRLRVICPAFVADCLETLEEIGLHGRDIFLNAGGVEFERIPCLNEHPRWLDALQQMAQRFVAAPAGKGQEAVR